MRSVAVSIIILSPLFAACADEVVSRPAAAAFVVLETSLGEITVAVNEQRASDSPYTEGQILDEPVMITRAYRKVP